jgi:membrane protein DedA with SNARE-associated domain
MFPRYGYINVTMNVERFIEIEWSGALEWFTIWIYQCFYVKRFIEMERRGANDINCFFNSF